MINKNTLIDLVHAEHGGSRSSAERIVDTVFTGIKEAVRKGEKVSIGGFGIFTSKQMKARTARNPKTGEPAQVAAHNKVKFSPAISFKELVN